MAENTAKARWESLNRKRSNLLYTGRDCAALTIPSLLPPEGHTEDSKLDAPYQGLGARGVNNLASKLLLALLPPNSPFFKFEIAPELKAELAGQEAEILAAFGEMENVIMDEIEGQGARVQLYLALRYLITIGNALVKVDKKQRKLRVYRFDHYVVKRDPNGKVLEIVIKEEVAPITLPDSVQLGEDIRDALSKDETVELYTRIQLKRKGFYTVYQEVGGMIIPETMGSYREDKLPYIALTWMRIDGEDYGRGLVEEHLGDLRSLETLEMALTEGSAAMSKGLVLVDPGGTTKLTDISRSENWAVKSGREQDVNVVHWDKAGDFSVAKAKIDDLRSELSYVFMLNSAVQRQAERVTAEEIRYMARELDDTLGGVYTLLSQDFQRPFLNIIMTHMQARGALPKLPKNAAKIIITTGLVALGRLHDLEKLDLMRDQILAVDPQLEYLDVEAYLKEIATALGRKGDLIKSNEEVTQMRQKQQMLQLAQTAAPNAVKGMMNG